MESPVKVKIRPFSELTGTEIASIIRLMNAESDETLSFDDFEDDFLNDSILCTAYVPRGVLLDLAGYAVVSRRLNAATPSGTTGYLSNILVASSHRGKGVGTRLLSSCLEASPHMFLYVGTDNKGAINLYEKHGFHIESFVPYFYQEWEPSSVMSRRAQAIYADAFLMTTMEPESGAFAYGQPIRRKAE